MTIIYSSTKDGGIGLDGQLVRTDKEDFRQFRKETNGGVLIMGRKTFTEINRALAHRIIIVVSTTLERNLKGVYFVKSIEAAESLAKSFSRPIYICGGAEIYKQFVPKVRKIIRSTWHDKNIVCDTYFNPDISKWRKTSETKYHNFTKQVYDRI